MNSRKSSDQSSREDALKMSEMRFKALVQDGTDLIAILDEEANYQYVSPTSERVLGISPEAFIGTNAFDYIHEEDRERVAGAMVDLPVKQRVHIDPFRFVDSQGEWRWVETVLTNMMDEPAVGGYVANSRDVTDQIEKEEQLRRLSLVASKTRDIVLITDPKDRITWVNEAFENLTGYNFDEAVGKNPGDLLQGPDTDPDTVKRLAEAVAKQQSIEEDILNYTKEKRPYWLQMTIDPVFDDHGVCSGFIAIERNITRQKKEEERLKLLESVITNTSEAIVILEAEPTSLPGRKVIYVNKGFSEMTGYNQHDVIGRTLHFLNGPETNADELKKLKETIRQWRPAMAEFINYKKSGEKFWVNLSMVPVQNRSGQYTHWILIGRDVTSRKRYQEQLLESLAEKETLLAEIHHRVKNNLAVVSGMIQLQTDKEQNPEVTDRLLDSCARIKTMSTIHEQLYQSNNFAKLEFSENIQTLVAQIIKTFQKCESVKVLCDCAPVEMNINQAVPCSLIVNEVVTNILKHAFPMGRRGVIVLNLSENTGTHQITLSITDNGVGIPDRSELSEQPTLGLLLIDLLVKQLKATSRYEKTADGTSFVLNFEKSEIKGSASSFM